MPNALKVLLPKAKYENGYVTVTYSSGVLYTFPVVGNKRLEVGTEAQLSNIEVSRTGLHWPDLDEDLSFAGLARGDYGQRIRMAC